MEQGFSRIRLDLEAGERFVALRRQLDVSAFGINLMLFEPGQRGRIHRHAHQEEVYLVWEGVLTLLVEQDEYTLERGDVARVGPQTRRQLVNRGPGRVAVIAIGGAGEHAGRDGEAFESWEQASGRPPQETPLPPDLPAS
jgi:mannose-6-phosphate isomerase-like protein (cupin superfamily)